MAEFDRAAADNYLATLARHVAERMGARLLRAALAEIDRLAAEVRRLQGIIAQHDLCHDLHGKVNAADFAAGCAAEQRRLYGCAPDADEAARLRGRVAELEDKR